MFLERKNEDIPDKEWEKISIPHARLFEEYIATYVAPYVAAYYIATGYYHSAIFEASFEIILRSCLDTINYFNINRQLKNQVKKLMRIQYHLEVIDEEPILKVRELTKKGTSEC